MLETIGSIKDERIILARAIRTRKGRDEHERILLEGDQEMSVEDMCRQFGILDAEVVGFLGPLTEGGLVSRDGVLRLTARGKEVLAKLWFTVESAESKILSGFTPKEAAALKVQLGKIQANCVQMMDGA